MDFKIKEIYLDNFKSFKDCRIKLDDFNVVIAPNNAGKSNLITALEFINSFFQSKYDLEKTINEFGGLETIKNYRSKKEENITIGIKLHTPHMFIHNAGIYVYINNFNLDFRISFKYKIEHIYLEINGDYTYLFLDEIYTYEDLLNIIKKEKPSLENFNFWLDLNLSKKSLSVDAHSSDNSIMAIKSLIDIELVNSIIENTLEYEEIDINDILKLDIAKVTDISTYYFISKDIKNFSNYKSGRELNKEGTNLASVLDYLKENYPDVFDNISTSLIGIVDELEGVEIKSDSLGRAKLEFVERINLERKQFIPVDIVSDGTINLIAILTALYEPYEKSLIAIEEPERHLHLRAISYLMEEFRNISEKKPILITTQSTEILHNLDLKKDNLIFLFRDYEGNTKAISHRDIHRFEEKLKAYNNDIVELIKLEGLGYLGDYIGEEE